MVWWHWLVIGLALGAAEIVTPGSFYMLFLGAAALIVGGLVGLGLPLATWMQVVGFCLLALVMLALFRGKVQQWLMRPPQSRDASQASEMIGEVALPVEDIPAGGTGRVELRGTVWTARSETGPVVRGQRCTVVRVEGLTLFIRSE